MDYPCVAAAGFAALVGLGVSAVAAAPAGHLVAVAKGRASALKAEKESRSSQLATRDMAPPLVAVVVALVGTRIGCYWHLSLGLGILRLKDSL